MHVVLYYGTASCGEPQWARLASLRRAACTAVLDGHYAKRTGQGCNLPPADHERLPTCELQFCPGWEVWQPAAWLSP